LFSRFLNALFGWLKKSAVSKADHEESPAERSGERPNERKSGPPEHWLEAVRSAGPSVRGGSDEIRGELATSEVTSKSSFESTTNGLHDLAAIWNTPLADHIVPEQAFQVEKTATTEVPKTAFVAEQRQIAESMQWVPAPKHNNKNAIARFFQWLTGSTPRKPVKSAYEKAVDKPSRSARLLKFDSKPRSDETHDQKWERPPERERTALLAFPQPDDSRAIHQPFYGRVSRIAPPHVQWERESQKVTGWVEFSRERGAGSEAVALISPAITHELSNIPMNPDPISWPELSVPRTSDGAALHESKHDLPSPETQVNNTLNVWPELPSASAKNDFNWRWMLRSVERSRRLDREQRGY